MQTIGGREGNTDTKGKGQGRPMGGFSEVKDLCQMGSETVEHGLLPLSAPGMVLKMLVTGHLHRAQRTLRRFECDAQLAGLDRSNAGHPALPTLSPSLNRLAVLWGDGWCDATTGAHPGATESVGVWDERAGGG